MPELKVGFARVDITPMLGTKLAGYYYDRKMEVILDPLLATAVAFDDGAFDVTGEDSCSGRSGGKRDFRSLHSYASCTAYVATRGNERKSGIR